MSGYSCLAKFVFMKKVLHFVVIIGAALLLSGAGIFLVAPASYSTWDAALSPQPEASVAAENVQVTHKPGQWLIYPADLHGGNIGATVLHPVDDPYDNVFHFQLDQAPAPGTKVWLRYELTGVQDHSAVARSINGRQSVGGYLVKQSLEQSEQREQLDANWLQKGDNVVRFALPEGATYGYRISNIQLEVEANQGLTGFEKVREIVLSTSSLYFQGKNIYVKGFVTGPGATEAKVFLGRQEIPTVAGEYEYVLTDVAEQQRRLQLSAIYPEGLTIARVFDIPATIKPADWVQPVQPRGLRQARFLHANSGGTLEAFGASITVPENALVNNCELSVTALRDVDLPPLPPDMVNVTKGHKGFRFLPDGLKFNKSVSMQLPIDTALIPPGFTTSDVRSYFFDEADRRWKMLRPDTLQAEGQTLVSATNHFTDFINGIIKVPESPTTQGYKQTEIKDIKVSDPSAGIVSIAPPTANNMGTANLSFPIKIPAGRQGMQPQLAIQYNSEGGNGWLGLGWDLSMPSITLDTRWGVPRYDPNLETETYLMGGDQLIPLAHRAAPIARVADRRFYPRVEGAFQKIIRHGNSPKNYYWEVISKEGVHSFYGGTLTGFDANAVLRDNAGNIAQWYLREVRDANGNYMRYQYTEVSDPGVPGSSEAGRQLYIQEISYTGHGSTDGKYKVLFLRDRDLSDPLRLDVQINGRLGFKQVTADLLRRIEISFDNKPVRSYELLYEEGAFYKTLLTLLIENDRDKKEFYRHGFDYFDEVRDGSGQYQPYNSAQAWDIPNDDLEGSLINPIPGFEDDISILGGSTSFNYSVSGALSFGIGTSNDKSLTVGGHYAYSKAKNDGKVALIDITGDGLPDKVFREGDLMYYERNLSGKQRKFASKRQVFNIKEFSHSETTTHSYGFDAEFFAHLGWDKSKSKTFTSVYFADFNGDRLMDINRNGDVWFNHLNADGDPVFTQKSSDTPCRIEPGAPLDADVLAFDPSEQAALEAENPLHDVIRLWKPPYKGQVTIYAPVRLLEDTSPDALQYLQKDGVKISIERSRNNNTTDLLWNTEIDSNDYNPHVPTGPGFNGSSMAVDTSDHLYFRVQSKFDGAYDQVLWNPEIVYTSFDEPTIPGERDPQDKPVNQYKASDDFVLGLGQAVGMEYEGAIHFDGTLNKPMTSDSITVQIWKTDKDLIDTIILYEKGFKWFETAMPHTFSIDTTVSNGDQIASRVKTATNVDWTAVKLNARLYYTSAKDSNGIIEVYDKDMKPLYDFCPSVEYTMFNYIKQKGTVFQPNEDGVLEVSPLIIVPFTVQNSWKKDTMDYTLTLSVKGINKLYAEKTFTVYADSIPNSVDTKVIAYNIPANEQIWVEYHIQSRTMADIISPYLHVDASFNGPGVSIKAGVFTTLSESEFIFGSMHRGWGQFAYYGNGTLGDDVIDRKLLKINDKLKNPPKKQDMQDVDHPDKIPVAYDPVQDSFIMMFPDAKRNRWLGFDEFTWVCPDTMSSSRMGDDDVRLVFIPPAGSSELQAPRLTSVSNSKTISGGLNVGIGGFGGGVSGSESETSSTTKVSVMDISGDNFPDIIGPDFVQITTPLGGRSADKIQHGFGNHASISSSTGASASGGYSAAVGKNSDTAGKGSPRISIGGSAIINAGNISAQGAAKSSSVSVNVSGSYNTTTDQTEHTWLDINGDGLIDKLYRDGAVQLNLGYRFTDKENWSYKEIRSGSSNDFGVGAGVGGLLGGYIYVSFSFSGGINVNKSESSTEKALQDINGDGLLDMVEAGNPMMVHLNTGNGFAEARKWFGGQQLDKNKSVGEGANASFTVCGFIPLWVIVLKICLTPGGSIGHSVSSEELQISDINGDGFPDLLESNDDGQLSVHASTIGRTNLLKTVHRPMNSDFNMTYELTGNTYSMPQSKWVLTSTETFDGLKGDGADRMKTTYIYENGQYNRRERDFYGFQTVSSNQLNTQNNDAPYRTITQTYKNDNYFEKGQLLRERMSDANGNLYTETINTYELRDPISGGTFDPNDETKSGYPVLLETQKLFYEGGPTALLQNRVTFKYDAIGNVIEYTDFGDETPDDVLYAKISYHSLTGPNILSTPQSIEVSDSKGLLRRREANVDNQGNVTQIIQYLAASDPAVFDLGYSPEGNLTKITRPKNYKGERLSYEYSYDPVVQTYVTEVKDGYGYVSSSTYDYAFGQLIESVDINKQRIVYSLDAKGRVDTIIGPYELAAGKAFTILNEYYPDAATPYAKTRHYDPANDGEIATITFMDGLQRPVQVKKTSAHFQGKNQADQEVMIVSGRINFDAFGRAVENYYPITEGIGSGNMMFDSTTDGEPPTRTIYDVLDRKTSVTLPDNATTTYAYAIGADNSNYTCFKTTETDPLNSMKENYTDLRGRTRAVLDYGPNGEIWTDFRYNPLSELHLVTDNAGNATKYEYDLLGRRLSVEHPDAGLSKFVYDLAGNMRAKITPNTRADGDSILYSYDFERLVQVDYPKNFQNMVRYSYGKPDDQHNRAGRIWLQEDASGGQEFFYGPLGEVRKNIRTVLVNNTRMITYVAEYRYDTWGRIDSMIYPDREVVKYRYNAAGKLSSVSGQLGSFSYPYVDRLGYDKFEQRVFLRLGNKTETNYSYDPQRRRLTDMTATDAEARPFMRNTYTYDAVSNILSLTNTASVLSGVPGGPASHTFGYDELYRLTEAGGTFTGQINTETYSLKMTYDDLHNILQKDQNHLRAGLTQTGTSYSQAYTYDTKRPHVPTRIANRDYTADANGNLTGWNEDLSNNNRFTYWDEENRIKAIWENGYLSLYTYDAGGARVLKSHGGLQVVYTNGEPKGMLNHRDNFTVYVSPYLVARDKQLTKHIYIEGQRIASKIGAGDLYYAVQSFPGEYLTAGNINYDARMKLLAAASTSGSPAPPTPSNPVPTPSGLPLYQPGKPNFYAYEFPKYTNDNVSAGFNLVDTQNIKQENNQYFFHPDHLGSTSYVTDVLGKVRQHVEYLPFGETFVEEHLNNDPLQPYLFNAKEFDAETGLYYYGARYYDPKLSIWMSVDPMAEKYPGWSPYNYTMLNPVKYVDPDGREIFSAIVEGTVAFGLEVGFDFAGSLLSGKDVSTAFQGINWGNALYEGGKAAVVSAVLPGASTTSKVGKLLNSPIGKLGLDFIGNTLKEINSDDNYDESGNLKISDVLLNSSISSGVSAWMGSGRSGSGKKIEAVKNNVQSALKKLGRSETVKQAENATKRLIGTVTSGAKQLLKHIGNEAGEKGGTNLLEGVIKARIMPPNESKN